MNVPVEVWSAVIGLLGGVVGVSIGAALQRGFERKHWERTIRLDAYDSYLTALDEFIHQLQQKPVDLDEAEGAKRETHQRLTRLLLVGSKDAVNAGRSALLRLTMLDYTARFVALDGTPVTYTWDDFGEANDERWGFIKASRKDIKAKPAVLPRPSVLPATRESEEGERDHASGAD